MIVIDGSMGEGGGQILRTSIAFAAITRTPIRIINIRRGRSKPGLAAQHVTAIKAVGQMCSAETERLNTGMTELEFYPGELQGGTYVFDIGTAGSITLVLQACLPAAICSNRPTILDITGGTDVKFSPPVDHFRYVLKPFLEKMGLGLEILFLQRGYYPKGGGRLKVKITPPEGGLHPLYLEEKGGIKAIKGIIHSANLPGHIVDRLFDSTIAIIKKEYPSCNIEIEKEKAPSSLSPGVGISIRAEYDNTTLGSSALGERGIPAEKLGKRAAWDLIDEMRSGATMDLYTADQMIPYIVLGGGGFISRAPLTSHTETNLLVLGNYYKKISREALHGMLIKLTNPVAVSR